MPSHIAHNRRVLHPDALGGMFYPTASLERTYRRQSACLSDYFTLTVTLKC